MCYVSAIVTLILIHCNLRNIWNVIIHRNIGIWNYSLFNGLLVYVKMIVIKFTVIFTSNNGPQDMIQKYIVPCLQ